MEPFFGFFLLFAHHIHFDTGIVAFLDPVSFESQHLFVKLDGLGDIVGAAVALRTIIRIAMAKRVLRSDGLLEGLVENRRILCVFQRVLVPSPCSVRFKPIGAHDAYGDPYRGPYRWFFAAGVFVEHPDVLPDLAIVEELGPGIASGTGSPERKGVGVGLQSRREFEGSVDAVVSVPDKGIVGLLVGVLEGD